METVNNLNSTFFTGGKKSTAFAIQELLGLSTNNMTEKTCEDAVNNATVADHHHQMTMAASRMAYLNAHAAVAAAFLPHGLHGQHHHHNLLQSGSGESFDPHPRSIQLPFPPSCYNYLVTCDFSSFNCDDFVLWNFFSFHGNKDIISYFMEFVNVN